MKTKKCFTAMLCILLVVILFVPTVFPAKAASGPTITTTLTDNVIQRGSKKTFDVWARNSAGAKIKATVKLNGQSVNPTWDDNEKTGYTLSFTKEGVNIVTVSASSDGGKKKELTYHITYQKAKPGEAVGSATWSVELFTIGCGYLIYPVQVPIYEGETAAEQLIRLLHNNGFVGYYSGTPKSSFYLGYVADGTASASKYNSYSKSGTPKNPKKLNLSPAIPSMLVPFLKSTMTFFEPDDYRKNWAGYIGEFAFTNGSGWMYSINNNFPNVGFADAFLSDGDVVRVQFTLAYGADIGGLGSVGSGNIPNVDNQPQSGYYKVADKDELSKTICKALSSGFMSRENVKKAYLAALSVTETLNASQNSVNSAVIGLNNALANPDKETNTVPKETNTAIVTSNTHSSTAKNTTDTSHSSNESVAASSSGCVTTTGSIGSTVTSDINYSVVSGSSSASTDTHGTVGHTDSVDATDLTDTSNTSTVTSADAEIDSANSSADAHGNILTDFHAEETENASNFNNENAPVNGNVIYTNEGNTEINNEKDHTSPINYFIVIGAVVLFAFAATIVVYTRNKRIKAVNGNEAKGSNENG